MPARRSHTDLPSGVYPNRNAAGEVISYRHKWREPRPGGGWDQRSRIFSVAEHGEQGARQAATDHAQSVARLRRQGRTIATDPANVSMTFKDLAVEWLRRHAANLSTKYADESARYLERDILPSLGRYRLLELLDDPSIFVEFEQELLDAGLGNPTRKKIQNLVTGIMRLGTRWHARLLPRNPAEGRFEPVSSKTTWVVRAMPVLVVERLVEAALQRPVRDPLTALYDAAFIRCMGEILACRPSELLNSATWGDIQQNTLILQTTERGPGEPDDIDVGLKTGARATRVPAPVRADLLALRAAVEARYGPQPENGLIFQRRDERGGAPMWRPLTDKRGRPTTDDSGRQTLVPVARSANLYSRWGQRVWRPIAQVVAASDPKLAWVARARFYDLRASAISLAVREQALNRSDVAQYAGHSVRTLERHYLHVIQEYDGMSKIEPADLIIEARENVAAKPRRYDFASSPQAEFQRRARARRKANKSAPDSAEAEPALAA